MIYINNDDINDIMETHKDIFNIISYEDLNKIL